MTQKQAIQLFEERKVRTVWDDEAGKWYVSIVDVIAVLTESKDAAAYWRKLKQRLKAEGNETVTNCHGLKMTAPDGKMRLTDVADVEQLFRLVQSIPSPKAEPFKLWLSSLARERLEEIDDPEQGIDRMLEYYHRKGYSENWINQRLKSIEVRKELTDEWERRGIKKGQEYATLTDIITLGWSGMTTRQYKQYKGLKTESLRDNMTNLELVLNMLAEATTTEISKERKPRTTAANRICNYNCPGQLVIGGEKAAVDKAAELAKAAGARRCLPLKVSGPFHTRLMAPAGDALAERFKTERFREMQIPVLFNCLGREKADADTIPDLLVKQVQSSVYMEDTLRRLGALGVDHILEVGPGSALSGFVKKTLPGVPCASVETPEQLDAALAAWRDEA